MERERESERDERVYKLPLLIYEVECQSVEYEWQRDEALWGG